jgi:hypothetical protein
VQTITTPQAAGRFIFEAFDDTVVANLGELYANLNSLLESHGILPGLERPKPYVASPTGNNQTNSPMEPTIPSPPAVPEQMSPEAPEWHAQTSGVASSQTTQARHAPTGEFSAAPSSIRPHTNVRASDETTGSPMPPTLVSGQATGSLPGVGAHPMATSARRSPNAFESQIAGSAEQLSGTHETRSTVTSGHTSDSTGGHWVDSEAELAPHPSLSGGSAFNPATASSGHVYSNPMDVTLSAFSTAQALLSIGRQLGPNRSVADGASAPYDDEQAKGAVSLLQSQESSRPLGAATTTDLNTRLTRALRSRHGYADKRTISEPQRNAIEMIEQLVSSIIEDPLVAAQIKPHIQRLEVPLQNAAMSDQEFFSAPDHPARQVLNQLGRLTGNAHGCLESTVERAISAAVEHVVHESTHDVGAYSHAAKQIERVIADQASRATALKYEHWQGLARGSGHYIRRGCTSFEY